MNAIDEIGGMELLGADVDRQLGHGIPFSQETYWARLVQHPIANVDDEIRLLGDGDEPAGRPRLGPAGCQRISASTPMRSPSTMCWGW